jgi:hypothetical protein
MLSYIKTLQRRVVASIEATLLLPMVVLKQSWLARALLMTFTLLTNASMCTGLLKIVLVMLSTRSTQITFDANIQSVMRGEAAALIRDPMRNQ